MHGRSLVSGRTVRANLNGYGTVDSSLPTVLGTASPRSHGKCCRSDCVVSHYLDAAVMHVRRFQIGHTQTGWTTRWTEGASFRRHFGSRMMRGRTVTCGPK